MANFQEVLSKQKNLNAVPMTLSLNDEIITQSNEELFQKSDKYLWYDEYYDNDYSVIDKNKNIKLSSSQVNLTQEENSQIVPFLMDRHYDGIDLMNMFITIYFVNKEGKSAERPAINVEYSDTKIRFYWKLDGAATSVSGKIKLEIRAVGKNEKNENYKWRTKPNEEINILEALSQDGVIEPTEGWESYLELINNKVIQAQDAADRAETAVTEVSEKVAEVDEKINNSSTLIKNQVLEEIASTLSNFYDREEIDKMFEDFDISDQLTDVEERIGSLENTIENFDGLAALDITYDENTNTISFFNGEEKIKDISLDVTSDIENALIPINENLSSIREDIDKLPTSLEEKFYTKEKTDELLLDKANKNEFDALKENVDLKAKQSDLESLQTEVSKKASQADLDNVSIVANANKTDIGTLGTKISELSDEIENIDKSPVGVYDILYEENKLSLLYGEDENSLAPKTTVTITGGSGGTSTSSTLKIGYVTKTPLVVTTDGKALITYTFSGTDSSGDAVLEGNATWKVDGTVVANNIATDGENTFDATEFLGIGTHKVLLTITDEAGSLVTKSWTVQKVDVRLESTFNDTFTYPLGDVSFTYTPYGAIEKEVHFILDGKEIGTVTTSASGIPMAYTLPSQSHGSHLLEVYMTALINGNTIESNHIFKDVLWYNATTGIPVIGCTKQKFTAKQHATTNVTYTVHDPNTETPEVTIAVDGKIVSTQTLERNINTYPFRSDEIGEHIITITCGDTVKTIIATITELGITIEPITAGLVFDFNPTGKSNTDKDRLWSYSGDNGSYAMTVSDNFDWSNGGYRLNENGEPYFCIKAGTTATIDYRMFADDAKKTGKEFKLVFKTTNVQEANAQFMSCIDNTTDSDHIGIEMFAHEASIYGSAGKLDLQYAEDEIIEFEFNINTNTDKVPEICGYEDGVPTRHLVYDDSFNFTQNTPKVITLGSEKCDLHIYRFKVYNTFLDAKSVLNNFVADARTAEEMLNRHYRNQIYNENQELTPEILAEKCPWLRVYKLSAPYFTNKKSDKVPYTTIQQIYKNGDSILDNWTCFDCQHSGQGTSSDNYGASARNIDFIMNKSGVDGVKPYFILGDGKTRVTEISQTRTSIPVAYLNFKANVASQNHFTNALLAKRYNEFNPYKLPYIRENMSIVDYIKTTMEFHNAVVFIQETDTTQDANGNYTTHREFNDCNWHFYSIGNIGDSKKTDDTRLVDPTDRYEFINEICDVDLPLSEWGNTPELLEVLENEKFDKSGTYEWRYIWEDGTDEENSNVFNFCKSAWINMYKFVVKSSDEEFKSNFEEYFVKDSMLYYYLFTERYCMTDNRCKNSFWHFGKTGTYRKLSNPIKELLPVYCELIDDNYVITSDTEIDENKTYYTQYAFDLAFGYDMDTAMSLNNYGASVYRHGYEDTDVLDGTTEEVFRESKSTIFCRIRDLFVDDLKTLYNTLESKGAWNAESFLSEIEAWQNEFPEELWRLDIDRKDIRTFNESFINGAGDPQYLKNMANGKMKYRVKQWERGQEAYMASKYQSSLAASDNAVLRCTVPEGNLVVPTNYKLKLTPYDYMYLNVKYGTQEPIQVRGIPNVQYEIPFDGDSVDIIDIYSVSRIQDLGDLSSTYPATVDTSKATRLKELHIGNSTEGYDNPSLTTMTLGANYLLEVLNVENVSGLTQSLNLSALNNLRELYAHGTNASGVTFANGGEIEIAELPPINSMTMRNLLYLTNLDITSLDKLTTLTIENCDTVDVKTMLESAPNVNRVRITDIDWILTDTTLLERIYNMSGLDKNGYNTERAVLTGSVHVPVIRQQQLADYQSAWSDLEITYDTLIEQFAVTFVNADADNTVLEVQYVDKGEDAIDPTTRENNPISPTIKSTISHDYTFSKWDVSLKSIFSDRTITAVYTESLRKYQIKYVSKGTVMEGYPKEGYYGVNIIYTGKTPTYTGEESGYKYYLFNRWDKSGFLTGDFDENGVKTVNAIYDSFEYRDNAFANKELEDMSPVEIYAMNQLGLAKDVITDKDAYTFSLGNDFNYDDVESKEIISEKMSFDGTNYYDTNIQLFDIDKDFVLAIDYRFTGSVANSVLAQCYQGSGTIGFKLQYNNGVQLKWGANTTDLTSVNEREIVVIRHKKGDTNLYIYNSNLGKDSVEIVSLASKEFTTTSTLVFGCEKQTSTIFTNYATGEIYWAKLWYADLGEEACKQLAIWTHESITLEACGFNRYYLSDNPDGMCNFSMLASHLLERTRTWNDSNTNVGGWAESKLNAYLNSRFYEAIPTQIKLLLKQVRIGSSVGNKSNDITWSDCYVAIPSVKEVDSTRNQEPYNSEGLSISYLTTSDTRKRSMPNGDYEKYWLRSPSTSFANYIWRVETSGSTESITNATEVLGILILLSF